VARHATCSAFFYAFPPRKAGFGLRRRCKHISIKALTRQGLFASISSMLKIRLQRVGKRNEPTFRIVVTDSANGPKSGRFLEILGSYDSREKNETKVDADKVKEWIAKGAQVSDTLHNLFVEKKIIEGKKINALPQKTPVVKESEEDPDSPEATQDEGAAQDDGKEE
jgi:small subunit ribosomal protein S16